MTRRTATLGILSALVVALGGALMFVTSQGGRKPLAPRDVQLAPELRSDTSPPSAAAPDPTSSPLPKSIALSNTATLLESMLEQLASGAVTSESLSRFRQSILQADPSQAIAALRAFLATGRDAATGEVFLLSEGGVLGGAPTLRVLLLDLLGQVARSANSDAADVVARSILELPTSADEWALSLRNVGWREPAAQAFLAGKTREMLTYEPWRASPSPGFLEAFDVAVYAGDAALVPVLDDLAATGTKPVQRAATVALDRLSEASPLAVLSFLNTHPAEFADHPFLRADYYAKADLSQEAQRTAIEVYLGRTDVSVEEKAKTLDSLASPASIIADTLLTAPAVRPEAPDNPQVVKKTYQEWIANGRFPQLRTQIKQVLANME